MFSYTYIISKEYLRITALSWIFTEILILNLV